MLRCFLVFVVVTLCSLMGVSASASQLHLGMNMADVHQLMGTPQQWVGPEHYYTTEIERSAALSVYGPTRIGDVYERRTQQNTYQIWIYYEVDDSMSRLHPTLRAARILFKADRALEADRMLQDIPEALAICKDGCHFQTVGGPSDNHAFICLTKFLAGPLKESIEQFYAAVDKSTQTVDETVFIVRLDIDPRGPRQKDWHRQRVTDTSLMITRASDGEVNNPTVKLNP